MNKITKLFGIEYPIIQGGMIWCSGWELASAVSNAGGLGLIGSGSMHPETLLEHIRKTKAATDKPFGVNIPLIYPEIEAIVKIIIDEKVPIVFTSAGNPKKLTPFLKNKGIKVVHVVSSTFFAKKSESAGVDAIVAEGFEAGGHNGREETTTLTLIPNIRKNISIPLIAAGGIAGGKSMLAAMVLGADGVQIGSRFVASKESSAHANFKQAVINAKEGHTSLLLKKLIPVRLINNNFAEQIKMAEDEGQTREELAKLLGQGRAKRGMFEGDILQGELEIGQVSAQIHDILPVQEIIQQIIREYRSEKQHISLDDKYNFI
ncbi:MAG TPA: nitronate monooxygenase [Bacteroidales bacterium]|nr:nitronate monooxygenase [Bacteroidales bacterium]